MICELVIQNGIRLCRDGKISCVDLEGRACFVPFELIWLD